jgi:hypothetical protein
MRFRLGLSWLPGKEEEKEEVDKLALRFNQAEDDFGWG